MKNELAIKLIDSLQMFGGMILGFSVFVIVYGGFKYATSQGDSTSTEQAKNQIIYGVIGMCLSILSMIVMKILSTSQGVDTSNSVHATSSEPNELTPFVYLLLGLFIGMPIIHFMIKFIVSKMKRVPVPKPSITLEKKEIVLTIHNHPKFSSIFSRIESVELKLKELDIEYKHKIHSMKNDVIRLFSSYQKLTENKKHTYNAKVMDGLLKIEKELQDIQENLETKSMHEIEKMLMIIDERYSQEEHHE
jgi:hypothetical protein